MHLAVVNSREVLGNVLTLAASGWTYLSTFILYDFETESMWLPFCGEDCNAQLVCISGEYADRKLDVFPAVIKPWYQWRNEHLDTKILRFQ